MLKSILFSTIFLFIFCSNQATAQKNEIGHSALIKSKIEKLQVLGSVLYFAAHPDDENTKLIAWLAQEKHYRTAYLSLTRGDGGQNLIGTEQGVELGLIRTQELLAARRVDQGEQYFTSAYDFGFSKTYQETFKFWDKEQVLKEAVWIIRKIQPDVIITRFPPDERGGHGHHQASAILAQEAFIAAANPTIFPEQLQYVKPWKAKRLLWNTFNFSGLNTTKENQLQIDIGEYNPLLGKSYGEISAESRSKHKSQGFGTAAQVGNAKEYFEFVAGEKANNSLFDQIDDSWGRIKNGQQIAHLLGEIDKEYLINAPEKSIPKLTKALNLVQKIDDAYWKEIKTKEIEEIIFDCAGLQIESISEQSQFAVGETIPIDNQFINRSKDTEIIITKINDQNFNKPLKFNVSEIISSDFKSQQSTQPYWLIQPQSLGKFNLPDFQDVGYPENKDYPQTEFEISINGTKIAFKRPIQYKITDPVRGELYNPIAISPRITAKTNQNLLLNQNGNQGKISITFENESDDNSFTETIKPNLGDNWKINPSSIQLQFSDKQKRITQEFTIQSKSNKTFLDTLYFETARNEKIKIKREINYDHIPNINWFPDLAIKVSNLQIQVPTMKVAYLVGAGDLIPESLKAIGIPVDLLSEDQILNHDLTAYDAIIVGIRAFNVLKSMNELSPKLLAYVKNGGTLVEQYNVNSKLHSTQFGPYPFTISRSRVTEELAEVQFDSKNPILNKPNVISKSDFDGWIQERGLYFAENIDSRYATPLKMNDQNEPINNGSLLITNYGSGRFVYTSLSFFRQLPAGVPGAYRLFVNLLSK